MSFLISEKTFVPLKELMTCYKSDIKVYKPEDTLVKEDEAHCPYVYDRQLVGDVLVASQMSDVFIQLLTQNQQLVESRDVEEVVCNTDVSLFVEAFYSTEKSSKMSTDFHKSPESKSREPSYTK